MLTCVSHLSVDKKYFRYLVVYLAISIGVWWVVAAAYIFGGKYLSGIFGVLTPTHPIMLLVYCLPSISGMIVYFLFGGFSALARLFQKLLPRKRDLFWLFVVVLVGVFYLFSVHCTLLLLGSDMPKANYNFFGAILNALTNFREEIAIIGGVFGWMGFLLPFLQRIFKHNVVSGVLTGLAFGIWILPAYFIPSFGGNSSPLLYLIQITSFILFQSYVFNATKGCMLFYIIAFFVTGAGTQLQLYYFTPQTQALQAVFYIIASVVIHFALKKRKLNEALPKFPEFIQA